MEVEFPHCLMSILLRVNFGIPKEKWKYFAQIY